jgi:formamidopyrimidine-DNA glycosylase
VRGRGILVGDSGLWLLPCTPSLTRPAGASILALMLHPGMSGHPRMLQHDAPAGPHDHHDLDLESGCVLRFNGPRRIGRAGRYREPATGRPAQRSPPMGGR